MKITTLLALAAPAALAFSFAIATGEPTPVAGTVTGRVVFDGDKPEIKPLKIADEQAKGCCTGDAKVDDTDRSLMVDDKNGIANVVITLTAAGAEVKVPEKAVELDQAKCRFEPHVVIVPEGTTVAYKNSDSISHNVHTYSVKNPGMNQTVAGGKAIEQKLEKAEPVKIACDIHPWMESYVFVTDATHWALSGRDGSFTIEGVPAGEYKLEIWHEKLGKAKADVKVNADGTSEAVEVSLGEKKGGGRRRR